MSETRVGLIGAGGISVVHADAWRALGATVVVHSHDGAQALADAYGFTVADSLDTLLASVDIVDIVTPSGTHRDLALAAIAAGCHVICEKPLAATADDARTVAAAADAAGVRLFPAHVVRWFAEYRAIRQRIRAGAIGTVATQRFVRMGSAPDTAWFFNEASGGGVVRDLMIHDIDQALWFAGPVTAVYAQQFPPTVDGIVPSPVTAHATLTHASGVISHLQATWMAAGLPFRTSVEVSGERGRLTYESRRDDAIVLDTFVTDDADYLPPMSPEDSPYYAELVAFLGAITDGGDTDVTAADGIEAVAVAEATMASIASGERVSLRKESA